MTQNKEMKDDWKERFMTTFEELRIGMKVKYKIRLHNKELSIDEAIIKEGNDGLYLCQNIHACCVEGDKSFLNHPTENPYKFSHWFARKDCGISNEIIEIYEIQENQDK